MERTFYRISFERRWYGESEWVEWHMHLWCESHEQAIAFGHANARSEYGPYRNLQAAAIVPAGAESAADALLNG